MIPCKNIIIGWVVAEFCPSEHAYVLMNLTTCLLFCMHSQLGLADYVPSQIFKNEKWNRFQVSPQPTSAQASGNNFIQSAHKVKSKITTFCFFRFLLKKIMIFTIWSRSHPQNQWKLYICTRECIDFPLVLRVTPGPNHGNHDFFQQKSRKSKRSDFWFYIVCTLYKIVSECLSRRGLWTASKKVSFQNLNSKWPIEFTVLRHFLMENHWFFVTNQWKFMKTYPCSLGQNVATTEPMFMFLYGIIIYVLSLFT